ncbi:hypothetical protein JCM30394_13450 [Deferrisoma palaeochoriense]
MQLAQKWARTGRVLAGVVLLAAAVSFVAVLSGCGSESGTGAPRPPSPVQTGADEPTAGEGGVLTLAAPSPGTLTVGVGTSAIVATLTDESGAPVAGQTVRFSASPTGVVALSASSAVTGADGTAAVTATGLSAGTASIVATFGSLRSTEVTLTVLAPNVSLSVSADAATVSAPGAGGVEVTATVTDHQGNPIEGLESEISFVTSLGELSAVSSPAAGQYRAVLTSTEAGTAEVTAEVLSAQSTSVSVRFDPGPVENFTLSPAPSQIAPGGTSTLSLTASDGFGNPIEGAVALALETTPDGIATLGSAEVSLDDGEAEVTLGATAVGTVTVRATLDGEERTAEIVVVESQEGQPASIAVTVDPPDGTINVKDVGGVDLATLSITVQDVFGNPIQDFPNNVQVTIVDGPGGGENLDGNGLGVPLKLSTVNGQASAPLQAGTLPGTVRILVEVLRDKDGNPLDPPLATVVPRIVIEAGPPFSVFLSRSNSIDDNSDGTLTHEYFAVVSDRYGNAVPDGTAVFFGQFGNILLEGGDGSVDEGGTVFRTGADLSEVSEGDTLAILEGGARGGYVIAAVNEAAGELTVSTPFPSAGGALAFAVGNNFDGGVLTSTVQTSTLGGVARWANTYPGELVNSPVYVYAETEGRNLGNARFYRLAWVAPTLVTIIGPDEGNPGDTLEFTVTVTDSASPAHYTVANLNLTVSATDGTLSKTSLTTDAAGTDTFTWQVPGSAASGDSFTITVTASDGTQATHDVSVGSNTGASTVITLIGPTTVGVSESNTYHAYFQDADDNALVGEIISISASGGTLDKTSESTDVLGEVEFLWTSPNQPGTYELVVTAPDGTSKSRSVVVQ